MKIKTYLWRRFAAASAAAVSITAGAALMRMHGLFLVLVFFGGLIAGGVWMRNTRCPRCGGCLGEAALAPISDDVRAEQCPHCLVSFDEEV